MTPLKIRYNELLALNTPDQSSREFTLRNK